MPKKNMTPEERKAFGEKMKAARAAKAQSLQNTPTDQTIRDELGESLQNAFELPPEPVDPGIPGEVDVAELQRQIKELQAAMFMQNLPLQQRQGTQAGPRGLIGTTEKYIIDPDNYPNPCGRISQEPKLERFAFSMNFELNFKIETTEYTTIDGIRTKEPKFTIELIRIHIDEDTGLATVGRHTVCRGIFFEDPDAAIVVARENGLEVDESNEKAFLDEMRYIRFRDWVLEAFYPPKPSQEKANKKEMVIDGKLVDYFEVNSEQSETIPFGQLKTKL